MDQIVQFSRGETIVTYNITTNNNKTCEPNPDKYFISVISTRDTSGINILVPQSTVTITDDSRGEECGKWKHKLKPVNRCDSVY